MNRDEEQVGQMKGVDLNMIKRKKDKERMERLTRKNMVGCTSG